MQTLKELKKIQRDFSVVPVAESFSADTLTPLLAFMRLFEKGQKAFFLESVEGGENIGRYCFLGISPFGEITFLNDNLIIKIDGEKDRKIKTKNPFKLIDQTIKQYESADYAGLPPFSGGAIGFVGFDTVRYFEKLPKAPNPIKELKNLPLIHLMLFSDIIAFDRVFHRLIIISNMFVRKTPITKAYDLAKKRIAELASVIFTEKKFSNFSPLSDKTPKQPIEKISLFGRDKFESAVRKVKDYIKNGDIFQCVISDQFVTPLKSSPLSIYRALRETSPAPYLFFLDMGQETLLGASPEMLTKVSGGVVETCPIAGTRPRGENYKQDQKLEKELLASVKEKAEHLMLVDLGRNDLGRVAKVGSVHVPEYMQVHRFSTVMHLVSLVRANLKKNVSPWQALASCFPAGTLSGAPKIRALEIIYELEPGFRGPYGGSVVYHDFRGHFDSCITIRSLLCRKNKGIFQAGAGIVYDSRPSMEYNEVLHKAASIEKAISLAQQREEQ